MTALLGAGAFAAHKGLDRKEAETVPLIDATDAQLRVKYEGGAGICPWREKDKDRARFFPAATSIHEEKLNLSLHQVEVTKRLGRKPTGDENVLPIFRALKGDTTIGYVMVRRLRGENGAVEIVLALDTAFKPIGLRVQRDREPADFRTAIDAPDFLKGCVNGNTSLMCGTGGVAAVQTGVRNLIALAESSGLRDRL